MTPKRKANSPGQRIRPLVRKLHGYVPGEQPRVRGLIKLNTNENPYPPSAAVQAALRSFDAAILRKYPPPTAAASEQSRIRHEIRLERRASVGPGLAP